MSYVFYVANPAYVTVGEEQRNYECLEGGVADALERFEGILGCEYIDLPDEEAFDAPLPAADYDRDEREEAAEVIDDYIDRLSPEGSVKLELDHEELVARALGARPRGAPPRPSEPDYEGEATLELNFALNFWERHMPWRAKRRAEARQALIEEIRARYREEIASWQRRRDERRRAQERWDERRLEVVSGLDLTSDLARREMLRELRAINYALPISCCCEAGEVGELKIHLAVPTLDEHIPGTRADVLKSGALTLKRASKTLRAALLEDACQTLAMRVALAALNAFARVERVSVIGLTADLDPVIALSTSRAELMAASPVSFEALGGSWSGGRPLEAT